MVRFDNKIWFLDLLFNCIMIFQRSVERRAYSKFNFFALNWSKTYWNTLYLNFQAERKVWDGKSWYCQVPISLRYLVTTIEGWPKADAIGLKIASTTKNLRWLQCGLQNYGYEIPELGARLLSSCLFDYRLVHLHHQTKQVPRRIFVRIFHPVCLTTDKTQLFSEFSLSNQTGKVFFFSQLF